MLKTSQRYVVAILLAAGLLGFVAFFCFAPPAGLLPSPRSDSAPTSASQIAGPASTGVLIGEAQSPERSGNRERLAPISNSVNALRRLRSAPSLAAELPSAHWSNDPALHSAALRLRIACLDSAPGAANFGVKISVALPPNKLGDSVERQAAIRQMFDRCGDVNSVNWPRNESEAALRKELNAAKWHAPTQESLAALGRAVSEGRLDIAEHQGSAFGLLGAEMRFPSYSDQQRALSGYAASYLSLCQLGDDCDDESLIAFTICVTFGSCSGSVMDRVTQLHRIAEIPLDSTEKLAYDISSALAAPTRESIGLLYRKVQ